MHVGYQQYTANQAKTATRGELVVLLYDICLRSLRQARDGLQPSMDIPAAHAALIKAQRALEELQFSLDMDRGQLAHNLYALYDFMIHELVLANLHKDAARVDNVIRLLEELADAWRAVAKQGDQPPVRA